MTTDGLPVGWVSTVLGAISERLVDGSHNPPPKMVQGKPMLSAQDVTNGHINFTGGRLIDSSAFLAEDSRTRARPGDVLLTIVGTIGRSAVVPQQSPPFTLQRSVAVIKPKGLDPRFLAYQLQSPACQRFFASEARGTAQKGVYLGVLANLPIRIAPISEQDQIVAEVEKQFTRLDAGVAALRRVQALLKRYRASVLKAACEGRLVPTEAELARREKRDYESAEDLLARILKERRARWEAEQLGKMRGVGVGKAETWKAKYVEPLPPDVSKLRPVPEGWVWTTVAAVGDVLLGRRRAPEYIGSGPTRPYLRVANIKDDRIDFSDVESMDFEADHFKRYELRPGDVLLCEGQSPERVGQSAIFRSGPAGLCFQATLNRFRSVQSGPSPEFAQIVFRSHVKTGVFMRLASITTNIAHLTLEKLLASPFPLPPTAEQERIVTEVASKLSVADSVEAAIQLGATRSARLRQSVLRQAFAGLLVPQDPNDEPAERLLARISASNEPDTQSRTNRAKGDLKRKASG